MTDLRAGFGKPRRRARRKSWPWEQNRSSTSPLVRRSSCLWPASPSRSCCLTGSLVDRLVVVRTSHRLRADPLLGKADRRDDVPASSTTRGVAPFPLGPPSVDPWAGGFPPWAGDTSPGLWRLARHGVTVRPDPLLHRRIARMTSVEGTSAGHPVARRFTARSSGRSLVQRGHNGPVGGPLSQMEGEVLRPLLRRVTPSYRRWAVIQR
jgi:hypothetical protein